MVSGLKTATRPARPGTTAQRARQLPVRVGCVGKKSNARLIMARQERGVEIAKGIRGCSSFVFTPIVGIATCAYVWKHCGWALGILAGILSFVVFSRVLKCLIERDNRGLTVADCFMPLIISAVCGIVFMPIALVSLNLFSVATCIYSGVLLSVALLCYRSGRIESPWWLVPLFLTFIYEILPIDLPTDLDNLLGVGVSTVIDVLAIASGRKPDAFARHLGEGELRKLSMKDDVIDV